MSEQHSSEASLVRCVISRNGKKKKALGDDMIASFVAYESIESPFMAGSLMISDSKDFLNTYPIQGGENIEMEVKSTFADKPYVYKFVIFSIGTRIVKNKTQLYILELISPEALINEGTRVQDPLTGNPEAIIKKIIREIEGMIIQKSITLREIKMYDK